MNKKSDHGFSLVAILAIVAAIAVLGFIAWRVWDASQNKQTNTSSEQKPQEQTRSDDEQPSASTSPYLEIKELGLKIELSEEIRDATYYYDAAYNAEYPDYPQVTISTKSLADKSNGTCEASLGIGPLGTVQKTTKPVDGIGNTLVANNETVFKLGDSFVFIRTPQSPCTTDPEIEALAKTQRTAFFEAFKSVQLLE